MTRWLGFVAAAFALFLPTAGLTKDRPKDAYQIIYDRMSDAHMNQLLAPVRPPLIKGDLEAAKRVFGELRKAAADNEEGDHRQLADLDMAWAVALANFEIDHDRAAEVVPMAIDSARSAVAGYSRFFGADHTETAIAKISLSDLLDKLPGKPHLDEQVALRLAAATALAKNYGAGFDVVMDSKVRTARILLEDGRMPTHQKQALNLVDSLIETRPNVDDDESRTRLLRLRLMRIVALIKTDQIPKALVDLHEVDKAKPQSNNDCWLRYFSGADIVAALEERGLSDEASSVKASGPTCESVMIN